MTQWVRESEHLAALRRRDTTIRQLQAQLRLTSGVASVIPQSYAAELVAAYEIAYGKAPNGDGLGPNGKPGSRPPAHDPHALSVLRRELALLERRAVRNPATSAGEGTLSKAVDGLERK